jgi:hypothetical protein
MRLTKSRLRRIIREEARRMDEGIGDIETYSNALQGVAVDRIRVSPLTGDAVIIEFANDISLEIRGDNLNVKAK